MKGGCLVVTGARDSGKTSLGKALERERLRRFAVLDVLEDYEEGRDVERVVRTPRELYDYLAQADVAAQSGPKEWTGRIPFSVALRVEDGEESEALYLLLDWCWRLGDCTGIIEEAHGTLSERLAAGDQARETLNLAIRIAKRGAHRSVDLWAFSQRLPDINAGIRSELRSSELWVLRLVLEDDLDVMRRTRGRAFAQAVADLPLLHALRVQPGEKRVELWKVTPGDRPTLELLDADALELEEPTPRPTMVEAGAPAETAPDTASSGETSPDQDDFARAFASVVLESLLGNPVTVFYATDQPGGYVYRRGASSNPDFWQEAAFGDRQKLREALTKQAAGEELNPKRREDRWLAAETDKAREDGWYATYDGRPSPIGIDPQVSERGDPGRARG